MLKLNWIRITLYGCLVMLAASCNGVGAPAPTDETLAQPASPPTAVDTQTGSEMTQPTPPPGMEPLVEKAREDLAQRLSIPISQIKLLEARQVTWPDASLGCPQPGMVYAQAPVDGLLIRLGVGKEMYFYHSGGNADLFLCESTTQIVPNATQKIDELVPPPDSEID